MPCQFHIYLGSFSDISRAGCILIRGWGWGVLLQIPCWLCFIHLGSFSYTSRADFVFNWGISLPHPERASYLISGVSPTQPVMALFFSVGSVSHTSYGGFLFNLGSFSYTSHAGFILSGECLLQIPCWILFLIWGVSLTHPTLPLFLCGEFLLHIPCWFHF